MAVRNIKFPLKKGEVFEFGKYDGKPLKWRVLDIGNDSIYVLCETIICDKKFDDSGDYWNDWSQSTLRKWLNEEFYNSAFDNEEKESIKEINSDKVTLLSKEDVLVEKEWENDEEYDWLDDDDIEYFNTIRAKGLISKQDRSLESDWWLRSASARIGYGAVWRVSSAGSLYDYFVHCPTGVRPALNLKL